MRVKVIAILGLAAGLFTLFILTTKTWNKENTKKATNSSLPVNVKQLSPVNDVIPVELKCENARLSAPDTFERLPCAVKNNTDKSITALVLVFSVSLEGVQGSYTDTGFLTIETLLHPDLREERKASFILPKGEADAAPAPTIYENEVIKAIAIQIDFVEFEDNSTLNLNQGGSQEIAKIREGAAKYREWLIKKYEEGGESESVIVSLLRQNTSLFQELNLEGGSEQGALQYRNLVRKAHEKEGLKGLNKYLGRSSIKTPIKEGKN